MTARGFALVWVFAAGLLYLYKEDDDKDTYC